MTSTVSTAVKIVVSMVVVAALVATTFNSKVRAIQKEYCVYGVNMIDCLSCVVVVVVDVTAQESSTLFGC
jgi:hypothetical protein